MAQFVWKENGHSIGLTEMVGSLWLKAMETMPAPRWWFFSTMTYRERLDAQEINYWGKPIPRIERVRRNLRHLKGGY